MLPDFPKAKMQFMRLYVLWLEKQKYVGEPILGFVTRYRQHEGEPARVIGEDGSSVELRPREMSQTAFMSHEDIRAGNLARVYEIGIELAGEMAGDLVRKMISDYCGVR